MLDKYITWQKQGDRSVEVKIDRDGQIRAWCYDYDLSEGSMMKYGERPPTKKELIDKKRIEYERKLEKLAQG